MNAFKMCFLLFSLSHIISDYYLQTSNIAQKKEKNIKWVLFHSVVYGFPFIGVFAIINVVNIWMYVIVLIITHAIIDILKFYIVQKHLKDSKEQTPIKRNIFIMDQIAHLLCLWFVSYWCAINHGNVEVYPYIIDFFTVLGVPIMTILTWTTKVLLVSKPANIVITNLLLPYKHKEKQNKNDKNTGKFIGTLERIIMLVLLSIQQYSAIGFVLTAKSIARYDKISKDQFFAEYYLLGTLLSTVIMIVVSFL